MEDEGWESNCTEIQQLIYYGRRKAIGLVMLVLLVIQTVFACVFFWKARNFKARLAKRLVCLNVVGAALHLGIYSFWYYAFYNWSRSDAKKVYLLRPLAEQLNYMNYWFLMRLKRVQVQLKAEEEETYKIIKEIRWSAQIQRIAVFTYLFWVIYGTIINLLDLELQIEKLHRTILQVFNYILILFLIAVMINLVRMNNKFANFFASQGQKCHRKSVLALILIW